MKAKILDSIKQARCSMNRLYMAIRTSDIKDIECRIVTEHLLKIHHSCIQITELMDDMKSYESK